VRSNLVKDERIVGFDRRDRTAVTTEPAFGGESVAVEEVERGRDAAVRAQLPVLIITCLTKV
jgi:hypothetical protein